MGAMKSEGSKSKDNRGNFLSRINENDQREHVRRSMDAPCKIAYLKFGMRGYSTIIGKILNISEGGALIDLPVPLPSGKDIYVVLENFPFKIAGVVLNNSDKGLHVKFANLIPEHSIHQIASGLPFVPPKNKSAGKPPKKSQN